MNKDFWVGKKVFITGHTGFKGSWLTLLLQSLGAKVYGYALSPPTTPSLFNVANIGVGMEASTIADIRDLPNLIKALQNAAPEIVIHMAAQPLVRYSYIEPVETYSVNVLGTVNLFEAVRKTPSVKAIINVTTDKCYENREWVWGYREDEPMGGYDPYSNSKGCAELVTSAYRRSFFAESGVALASARAGNVIGGGDWALDRLLPDFLLALDAGEKVIIRSPNAIRPWQHVLEPLSGYLTLAEKLFDNGQLFAEAWNFGPSDEDAKTVEWILDHLVGLSPGASWYLDENPQLHEAHYLKLDSSKSKTRLSWQARWRLETTLDKIIFWHRSWKNGADMHQTTMSQIFEYKATLKAGV